MELNEKVIGDLSSRLKIDSEALKTALTDESAESIELKDVVILTKEDKATLESNLKSQAHSEGKKAGEEMLFKNFKKSKGIEIEAKDFDEYFEKFEDSIKSNFTGDIDAKLRESDEKISKLQSTLQEKEGLIETIKSEYDNKLKGIRANTLIETEVAKLDFDVPKHIEALGEKDVSKYIEAKRKQTLTLFKNTYKTDFEENNPIFIDSNGNKLVNELQQSLAINDVMQQFAKENYLTIADNKRKGRGSKSSSITSGTLKGISKDEFLGHLKDKGINPNSQQGGAMYSEWLRENE